MRSFPLLNGPDLFGGGCIDVRCRKRDESLVHIKMIKICTITFSVFKLKPLHKRISTQTHRQDEDIERFCEANLPKRIMKRTSNPAMKN